MITMLNGIMCNLTSSKPGRCRMVETVRRFLKNVKCFSIIFHTQLSIKKSLHLNTERNFISYCIYSDIFGVTDVSLTSPRFMHPLPILQWLVTLTQCYLRGKVRSMLASQDLRILSFLYNDFPNPTSPPWSGGTVASLLNGEQDLRISQ
jgi:hypothetical protein